MKSVMSHQFSQVPRADIPRSSFNRNHGFKTTFDGGYLVPIFLDEALPGDTFNLRTNLFARLATPLVPIMDNMFLDTFYFSVPLRLLWDNFQKFNGERINPADSTSYVMPTITCPAGGWPVGSLSDYFGLPTGIAGLTGIQSMFHRGYNKIWNDWFRDENLQNSLTELTGDGPDADTNFVLKRRGKRHDYFTSSLPWPQKGTAVSMPLGTSAPIRGIDFATNLAYNQTASGSFVDSAGIVNSGSNWSATSPQFTIQGDNTTHLPGLYADLTNATAATINTLRQAFQFQKLYERDARGGTRYCEIIQSHFGVSSPANAILQRPEYLGGSSSRIQINPVQQNSVTATTPQGHLAAFGVAGDSHHGFSKSFVEHSIIIGLVNVRADLTYQQGIPKMFTRSTRFDYFWPALAHLGEQAVLNKEIYAQGNADDNNVFGYQERWAEYRYKPSTITGKFRSTYATPLDCWHLSQKFTSLPTLGDTFIQDNPPISRVVAVVDEPQFLLDCYFELTCARPMPVYSTPGLIDHF